MMKFDGVEEDRIKQVPKWGDNRGLSGDKAGYAGYDDSGAWICRNHMCNVRWLQNKDWR